MLALTRLRSRTEILSMGDTAERHSYA